MSVSFNLKGCVNSLDYKEVAGLEAREFRVEDAQLSLEAYLVKLRECAQTRPGYQVILVTLIIRNGERLVRQESVAFRQDFTPVVYVIEGQGGRRVVGVREFDTAFFWAHQHTWTMEQFYNFIFNH